MPNTVKNIEVSEEQGYPSSPRPGAAADVSSLKPEYRTLEYSGAADDLVDIEGCADGVKGWVPLTNNNGAPITFVGAAGRVTINDRGRFYRSVRRGGKGAAILTCTGGDE